MTITMLIVATLASSVPATAEAVGVPTAVVAASGCAIDDHYPIADARRRPGVRDGGTVVATLSGGGGDDLGDLCVALVREDGKQVAVMARQAGGPVTIADEVAGLSRGQVEVDPATYRFAPGETAIGVRVGGYYSSTATEVSWSILHLLRSQGDRLVPILTVRVDESMTDKGEDGGTQSRRWTVHMARTMRHGAYDIVVRDRRNRSKAYVWNGTRYVAARPR